MARIRSAKRAALAGLIGDGWARVGDWMGVAVCVLSADPNWAYVEVEVRTGEPRREEVLLEWQEDEQAWSVLSSGQTGLHWSAEDGGGGRLICALGVSGDENEATVTFAGREYRLPVADGFCLFVEHGVPEELADAWPRVRQA